MTTDTQNINIIDLFTGTGAFSSVFLKNERFKCVFANDIEKNSEKIFKINHPNSTSFLLKDLNDVDVTSIPSHNILCGGFPCQPFSIAGEQKGFNDTRSNVFWKILEIIDHHTPEIVILENVKNLKTHDKKRTFTTIKNNLTERGYFIHSEILDTCKITNIPQHRERIYIVCFKHKEMYDNFNFNFEQVENEPIINFLENNVSNKYYYRDSLVVYNKIEEGVKKHISENVLYQYRRYYVRENKSNCCPTLTANMGGGGHNVPLLKDDNGIRKLTPRECFNLQGFDRDYILPKISDSALYKLAGNSVSIPVIKLIIDKIKTLYSIQD